MKVCRRPVVQQLCEEQLVGALHLQAFRKTYNRQFVFLALKVMDAFLFIIFRQFCEKRWKFLSEWKKYSKTRCRPSKGRRCIPDVDIWVHVETYLNDFSSSAQVKIQVEFNFELFWKINQIFWFPCCSTREDLSVDVSITNVGLILTKLRWF